MFWERRLRPNHCNKSCSVQIQTFQRKKTGSIISKIGHLKEKEIQLILNCKLSVHRLVKLNVDYRCRVDPVVSVFPWRSLFGQTWNLWWTLTSSKEAHRLCADHRAREDGYRWTWLLFDVMTFSSYVQLWKIANATSWHKIWQTSAHSIDIKSCHFCVYPILASILHFTFKRTGYFSY